MAHLRSPLSPNKLNKDDSVQVFPTEITLEKEYSDTNPGGQTHEMSYKSLAVGANMKSKNRAISKGREFEKNDKKEREQLKMARLA